MDEGPMPDPSPDPSAGSKVVLAATDRPVTVRVDALDEERTPEGMICLGTYLESRLVARCVVPPDAWEFYQERGLFKEPVRLVLAAREAAPGLQCQLFALLPISPSALIDEPEPWAASVPGSGYESAVADVSEPAEPGADPGQTAEARVGVFLGQIVRFDKDRKHSDNLALEAIDVLSRIVSGEVSEVVDKVLEDLLGNGPLP